ncbi:hypothetical protein [Cellulosimicrobium aquatile]|uniref:hypothetical protein n=1 Tax=Cellulosimicrobium aquatile TaxID=1612203 RepID=UPI001177CF3B|nr:hypothetical protein [Cellulosimicrobium aquatile]
MTTKLERPVSTFVANNAMLLSGCALLVSVLVELLQAVPEIAPFGHEFGEVARNLGYGIAAAFAFNWIMIEVPERRDRERVLASYWWSLNYLAVAGAILLAKYRNEAPEGPWDTQTEAGMKGFLRNLDLIETWEPRSDIRVLHDGVRGVQSDPFAGTAVLRDIDAHGRLLEPFLHRLHPEVSDAVAALIHLPDRISMEPVFMRQGTLDAEFGRIWELVSLSRDVRSALLKHVPNRSLVVPQIMAATPTDTVTQVHSDDL